jgi:hypothetical protein
MISVFGRIGMPVTKLDSANRVASRNKPAGKTSVNVPQESKREHVMPSASGMILVPAETSKAPKQKFAAMVGMKTAMETTRFDPTSTRAPMGTIAVTTAPI